MDFFHGILAAAICGIKPLTGGMLMTLVPADTGMMQACRQLFAWLERGSVDKRSAGLFYSLVQSCNGHVRRLLLEKQQQEHELNQARVSYKQCVQELILQCESFYADYLQCYSHHHVSLLHLHPLCVIVQLSSLMCRCSTYFPYVSLIHLLPLCVVDPLTSLMCR